MNRVHNSGFLVQPQVAKPLAIGGAAAIIAGIVASVAIAIFAIAAATIAIPFTAALAGGGAVCLAIGLKTLLHQKSINNCIDLFDRLIQQGQFLKAEDKIDELPEGMRVAVSKRLIMSLLKGVPTDFHRIQAIDIMRKYQYSNELRLEAAKEWLQQLTLKDKAENARMICFTLQDLVPEASLEPLLKETALSLYHSGSYELAPIYSDDPEVLMRCWDEGLRKQNLIFLNKLLEAPMPEEMECSFRVRLAEFLLKENKVDEAVQLMQGFLHQLHTSDTIKNNLKLFRSVQIICLKISFALHANPEDMNAESFLVDALGEQQGFEVFQFCYNRLRNPLLPFRLSVERGDFEGALNLLLQEWKNTTSS